MQLVNGLSVRAVALSSMLLAGPAMADPAPIVGALGATRPIIDTRLRFEDVDQEPMADSAEALTLRARLGFETGKAWGTLLLAEGELVWPLTDQYNSTTNGNTRYPTVADPESYEINRLQLVNTSLAHTAITLGRQRINLDDQRFVGNVGWRQNEQTFDSLRLVDKSLPNLTFDVSYVNQVNRVFGKESRQGRYRGDSFLGNVSYDSALGKVTAFGYWMQFEPIATAPAAVRDSSETFGVRVAGERALSAVKLAYTGSYASQHDYDDNPLHFDNDYYLLELTGTFRQYSAGLGIEVLEGDGAKGFTTPLATLHKFQGWADKFLTTPADGIDDKYVSLGYSARSVAMLDALSANFAYHDFESERLAVDLGSELDLQVQAKYRRLVALLKLARYDAHEGRTPVAYQDTTKFWVQLEYAW
jgi:hypothetical protein